MSQETRDRLARVRGIRSGAPGVTLQCIRTRVVDDYGSLWMANTFDESLQKRLPTLCWAHSWTEPLGPGVSYQLGPDGPSVDFLFSDFDAVPSARRAYAQVKDGTIQDCSVGFSDAVRRAPTADELELYPTAREVITKATLDEVSLVLRGAVEGAKVLSVRDRRQAEMAKLDRDVDEAVRYVDELLRTSDQALQRGRGPVRPASFGIFGGRPR